MRIRSCVAVLVLGVVVVGCTNAEAEFEEISEVLDATMDQFFVGETYLFESGPLPCDIIGGERSSIVIDVPFDGTDTEKNALMVEIGKFWTEEFGLEVEPNDVGIGLMTYTGGAELAVWSQPSSIGLQGITNSCASHSPAPYVEEERVAGSGIVESEQG